MKSADIKDIPDGYISFNGAKCPKEVATMEDLYAYLTDLFESSDDTAFAAVGLEAINELRKRVILSDKHLMGATEAFAILHSLSYRHSKVYKKDEDGKLIIDQRTLKHVLDIINGSTDIRETIEETREFAHQVIEL
ncbi:hypothetical protein JW752_02910 [Candidatus Peregrinibacteria bacterium]|nr:hypothetical protein [Candidatus Peregrinibacteria bacterium]